MQILILVIIAYLFLPVIGELFLITTDGYVVAGDITWGLFYSNLVFALIVVVPLLIVYLKKKKLSKFSFQSSSKDRRTLKRIAILISIFCIAMFYFSGYDYLVRGIDRGQIRVNQGLFGFLSKWVMIYAIPLLLFITTIIMIVNKNRSFIYFYIYGIALLAAFFTGYKFVVIFCFIPVMMVIFYNKNILKTSLIVVPIVLAVLSVTTMFVMGFKTLNEGFYFILHRMTVMSSFGTIGVWNNFPNGASFSEIVKLTYSVFGNRINEFVFGIEFNSLDVLDVSLSRKITYMVYPSWEKALSGTSNVTVTSFGEAVYIFGKYNWVYALISSLIFCTVIGKIMDYFTKGDIIKLSLFVIYCLAVLLSWLNSSSIFTLISLPIVVYMFMSYIFLLLLLKSK